jgi:deoxyribonuclease V
MKTIPQHRWDVSIEEAKKIQEELSRFVISRDNFEKIEKIAGVGVAFSKDQDRISVACANFSFPKLQMSDQIVEERRSDFLYRPGLFAFSVGPAILSGLKKMERPDLIIFPGKGIYHPRGLGLASHLGVLLGVPTTACSKRPLWKNHPDPPEEKGAHLFVEDKHGELIGAIVRTRHSVKPIYVTIGHKISIQTAVKTILECSKNYRIPEPLRYAHILARNKLDASL